MEKTLNFIFMFGLGNLTDSFLISIEYFLQKFIKNQMEKLYKLIILLYLITTCIGLLSLESTTKAPSSYDTTVQLSNDGLQYLSITGSADLRTYQYSGSSYVESSALTASSGVSSMKLNEGVQKRYVVMAQNDSLSLYGGNESYSLIWGGSLGYSIDDVDCSNTGLRVILLGLLNIVVYDVFTNTIVYKCHINSNFFTSFDLSSTGHLMVAAANDSIIRVFNEGTQYDADNTCLNPIYQISGLPEDQIVISDDGLFVYYFDTTEQAFKIHHLNSTEFVEHPPIANSCGTAAHDFSVTSDSKYLAIIWKTCLNVDVYALDSTLSEYSLQQTITTPTQARGLDWDQVGSVLVIACEGAQILRYSDSAIGKVNQTTASDTDVAPDQDAFTNITNSTSNTTKNTTFNSTPINNTTSNTTNGTTNNNTTSNSSSSSNTQNVDYWWSKKSAFFKSIVDFCLDNIKFQDTDLCVQTCEEQCQTCEGDTDNCLACAFGYKMEKEGTCKIGSTFLQASAILAAPLSAARPSSWKQFVYATDTLWLFHYHKASYTPFPNQIFAMIRFIEEKKYSLLPSQSGDFIEKISQRLPQHPLYTNPKYFLTERKGDTFFLNVLEYCFYGLPLTLALFLLLHGLFRLFFNYSISQYVRTYSFPFYFFLILFDANSEYFSFLFARNSTVLFSTRFTDKVMSASVILIAFVFFLWGLLSYLCLYWLYGKHCKYFLDNMYRVYSSIPLMSMLYGFRPMVKGTIHALLYQHNNLQLILLGGIQMGSLFCLFGCEMAFANFKSKFVWLLDCLCMGAYTLITLLLTQSRALSYSENDKDFQQIIDYQIKMVVYFFSGCTMLRMVFSLVYSPPLPPKKDQQQNDGQKQKDVKVEAGQQKPKQMERESDKLAETSGGQNLQSSAYKQQHIIKATLRSDKFKFRFHQGQLVVEDLSN